MSVRCSYRRSIIIIFIMKHRVFARRPIGYMSSGFAFRWFSVRALHLQAIYVYFIFNIEHRALHLQAISLVTYCIFPILYV